ncbi:MAG: insulinase family protein [Desulfotignum sp.]
MNNGHTQNRSSLVIRQLIRTGCLVWAFLIGMCVWFNPAGYALPVAVDQVLKDPAVVHGTLSNGFQYVLMKNTTPKDRVSIYLNIFAGSAHETDKEQGVAHFLEHMLFNGTEHFSPGELVTYFQSIGMDFGADVNASTSFFHTVYDLSLPRGDQPHIDDALRVLKDYAQGALLLEEEIDRERGIILAEKQERDSVSYRTFKAGFEFELPGSILPQRMPIGTTPVIEAADQRRLKQFYDRWYRPDNMVLIMVGDMDINAVEQWVFDRFQSLEPRMSDSLYAPKGIPWEPHKGIKSFHYHEPEAGSTRITIEQIEYTDFSYETEDTLTQKVTRTLADTMLQNRFSRVIQDGQVDFSSASAYSGRFLNYVSSAAVTATCDPGNWETSLAQLEKLLRQAVETGFTQVELARVKADFLSRLESEVRQADTRETPDLARSLRNAVQDKKWFLSPTQARDLLTPHVQDLTLDAVNEAFQATWDADHRLVMVTGNAQISAEPTSAQDTILKVYQDSSRQTADLFEISEAKSFPYLPVPTVPAAIEAQREDVKHLGITEIDFDNQIRLNLKQTDFQEGRFLFKVAFGHGRSCEPEDIPGIAFISEQVLHLSGLGRMTLDQLNAALAGRDISMEFSVEDTCFSLSGSADPWETERVFQLIQAFLTDPGFRPESLALAKNRYRQMYESLKQTPDGIMRIHGDQFLARGDAWFGMAHPNEMDRLTLADIQAWLIPYFHQGGFEVSVVGDFDPQAVISHARTLLGGFSAPQKAVLCPDDLDPIQFPEGEHLLLTLDSKIDKGVVRIAFLTDDYWDVDLSRGLSMLSRVMSEHLRKTIREKLGEAYGPYVYNRPSRVHDGYGVLQMVVPVSRENVDKVTRTLHEIIAEVLETGVSEQETELALAPVLKQLDVLRQTNAYWLNSVMAGSKNHPQKLDWANSILSGYGGLTHKDMTVLARRYLNPEKSAEIRILPAR